MKPRTRCIALGVLIVALFLTETTGVPTEPSVATPEACPVPQCSGPKCRGTKLGPNGCQVCDCDGPEQCPVVQCAPGCIAEESAPEGRCPTCVCNAPAYSNRAVDVPCFTPLLREALRRLAEVEEQLHQLRLLTQENGVRLHRLLPPVEHHPHQHPPHHPHHQPHHPAPPHAGNPEAPPPPAAPAGGDAKHANSTA
ncbi:uncharacterized protein LOC119174749 isoform X2 [Rhipicephalus microplus]|uniref:uncharacterized protein LOC119174749 isoform X2 n=1 Tax=Rhipicephalus microplus TaxID=6941 RepID=UPI00188858E4|nr:uncharacterized protein LOC119174749 isoform X2 [Rhipicephalus microplus]